ncbi:hypothetical protein [Variovorax paradoxus]|uniref:hypothetical protein n=1 Tax=Variovorax paradoxus TaxID=34073 RepID=UPI00277D9A55|nr:hypothetical protein [Variovorax paradoxus]MDQ0591004.1 hypothetical protein [Variovorax paradoxus]
MTTRIAKMPAKKSPSRPTKAYVPGGFLARGRTGFVAITLRPDKSGLDLTKPNKSAPFSQEQRNGFLLSFAKVFSRSKQHALGCGQGAPQ